MIRFLYRAGSEQTQAALIESIREDLKAGAEALLLVPEQETVSVERRMLKALPPSAQLSFEVLNFSRLANRTFRALGGLSYRAATPAVSALLMWRTIGQITPFLRQYGSSAARDSALCELMLRTEAQCKASCIPPEKLLRAAEELPENEPLREKLGDIGLTLSTYESALGERFDNAVDDLTRLAALLAGEGKALFEHTHIYIDSFTDFTAQEMTVLRGLFAAAPSVTVTFPLQNGKESGLHLTTVCNSHRRLRRMADELSLRVIAEETKDESVKDAIRYLSHHLFDMTAEPAPAAAVLSEQIKLYACSTPFEEAAGIACEIQRLIRRGYHYRDIAVVVRDTADWIGILDAALEKEGIPYFLSEKTDITTRPLIKLIIEALRIRLGNWREEDVIGYLKTGLCGACSDDVNLFEEYASVWHPRGEKAYNGTSFSKNPDGYTTKVSERGKRILEGANRVKDTIVPPLAALFSRMDAAEDATGLCRAIYDFLEELHIRDALKAEAERYLLAGDRREAEELSRLYAVTVDALEAVSAALGEQKLTVSELTDALKLVFARTDIGVIPTSADEVTVGSASMLRTDHPKFIWIAGLNEGIFPRTVTDDGLLGDADKKRLSELGVEFSADSARLSSDELFFIHRAVSAPQEGLYLSYSRFGTDGRALTPSVAVDRVKSLFPMPEHTPSAEPVTDRIYTPAGAMEALAELPKETANRLLCLLEERGISTVQSMRRPVVDGNASIPAERARSIFGDGRFNPTHLEKFSACRFAYYCSKVLKLREEPSDIPSAADVGDFIHYVLEKALERIEKSGLSFSDQAMDAQRELVADIAEEYRVRLTAFGELTPRTEALLKRLTALARVVISGLLAELCDSDFKPAFLELDLSGIGKKPSIRIGDTVIPLSGKIDRVDFWKDQTGRAYLRVTDYKTGTKEFSVRDIEQGFSMQMPIYLMALCRGQYPELALRLGEPRDTVFYPAGISYFSSNVGTELTTGKRKKADAIRDAAGRLTRSGLTLSDPDVMKAISFSLDERVLGNEKKRLPAEEFQHLFDRLEDTVSRIATDMRSGDAKAEPHAATGSSSPCNYCGFAPICRRAEKSNH